MYPGVGTFVLIRLAQTFYERIKIALFYSERGRQTWASANQRAFLAVQQLAPAQESLRAVEYEIGKVR